jgi:hypothetical protein
MVRVRVRVRFRFRVMIGVRVRVRVGLRVRLMVWVRERARAKVRPANPWQSILKILKDCFPMINTADKTKKGPFSYHVASSGMNPLSVSCVCWKSE